MRPPTRRRGAAFTILEILVAVGILALLAALIVPMSDVFVKRAKKAKCISNMRSLHSGLSAYTLDKGHWPQMEEGEFDYTEEDFFGFWIEETSDYGLSQENWVCPSDRALERLIGSDQKPTYFGSYVVTRFDDKPQTPFRWNQPWIMERGNFHGKGVHILMPDGSVQDSRNPFYGR